MEIFLCKFVHYFQVQVLVLIVLNYLVNNIFPVMHHHLVIISFIFFFYNISNLDVFKKRFLDSIGQSNSQIFTEDLRNMIMSANNDQETDAVIQALKKYLQNHLLFQILIYVLCIDIVQIKLNLLIIILVRQ